MKNEIEPQDDLDLSDDDGHAGDSWDALLKESGADQVQVEEGGGELVATDQPPADEEAAGYRDLLVTAINTTSYIFGWGLDDDEVKELARAYGRVADHYLPECPTQESPLLDALFTTGTIAGPRVLARILEPGEEGAEPGPEPSQPQRPKQPSPKVVAIRPDDPNGWAKEKEKEW